jgi:hypothetical protein
LHRLDNALLAVVVAGSGWWGYQRLAPDEPPRPTPHAVVQAAEPSALELLDRLEVKGRAPKTGYDRKLFGVGAVDFDRNGCDYRNDTLRRDLDAVTLRPGEPVCVVEEGTLVDPYTGDRVTFVRGDNPSPIEIDHRVALSDAWQKGAHQWSEEKRFEFGNDPRNLVAVSRAANQQKGASDAATWLPPDRRYRCEYVARQVEVKAAYGLWVTAAEHDAMRGILDRC